LSVAVLETRREYRGGPPNKPMISVVPYNFLQVVFRYLKPVPLDRAPTRHPPPPLRLPPSSFFSSEVFPMVFSPFFPHKVFPQCCSVLAVVPIGAFCARTLVGASCSFAAETSTPILRAVFTFPEEQDPCHSAGPTDTPSQIRIVVGCPRATLIFKSTLGRSAASYISLEVSRDTGSEIRMW